MRKNCSKDVSREHRIEILFVFGVFLFYFLWSCTQRYNFSADESMRYQIAQFIYEHGSLPRGDDPLIRNEDWGTSYAFNPILSYMASAVLMKGMSLFTTNEWMLLLSARFVNVLLGALMAWVVLKAAKLLFPRRYAWMFTALVVFQRLLFFIPGSRRIRKDGTGQLVQCLPLEWVFVSCRITMRMDLS